jgi:predicted nucleotidyltransferase component of viral defense system
MTKRVTNQAASVHQRLLNLAKSSGRPFNELLQFYAIERFLYRLAQSQYRDRLVLKGALMLLVWKTPVTRPTRDIDLLARISNDLESVRSAIADICRQAVEDDGLVFEASTVTTGRIAEDADYEGVRARFQGHLGKARIAMQIDLGFSDVITPAPVSISYPAMLGHASADLLAYSRETVVAEKLEAMVMLGQLNSRMKDFFDLWLLARTQQFEGRILADAISRTFARRQTPVVADPVCFTDDFATDAAKMTQWAAFVRNGKLSDAPASFQEVVTTVRIFLQPALEAVIAKNEFSTRWRGSGAWTPV